MTYTGEITAKIVDGPQAACFAHQLWADLPPARRRMILWELPEHERLATLRTCLRVCDKVCVAWDESKMLGMSWVMPMCRESKAGIIHLAWGGERDLALALGRLYYKKLTHWYDTLCMFVPITFRHIRAFIEALGYKDCATLKHAAPLADHNRCVDAKFYVLDLQAAYGQ